MHDRGLVESLVCFVFCAAVFDLSVLHLFLLQNRSWSVFQGQILSNGDASFSFSIGSLQISLVRSEKVVLCVIKWHGYYYGVISIGSREFINKFGLSHLLKFLIDIVVLVS